MDSSQSQPPSGAQGDMAGIGEVRVQPDHPATSGARDEGATNGSEGTLPPRAPAATVKRPRRTASPPASDVAHAHSTPDPAHSVSHEPVQQLARKSSRKATNKPARPRQTGPAATTGQPRPSNSPETKRGGASRRTTHPSPPRTTGAGRGKSASASATNSSAGSRKTPQLATTQTAKVESLTPATSAALATPTPIRGSDSPAAPIVQPIPFTAESEVTAAPEALPSASAVPPSGTAEPTARSSSTPPALPTPPRRSGPSPARQLPTATPPAVDLADDPTLAPRPTRKLPVAATTSGQTAGDAQRQVSTQGNAKISALEPRGRAPVALVEAERGSRAGDEGFSAGSLGTTQPRFVPRTGIAARPTQLYRRRRRYMRYIRRSARTRQAERAFSFGRAIWAAMVVGSALLATIIAGSFSAAGAYYESRAGDIAALSHTIASKDSLHIYDINGNLLYESADHGVQQSISLAKMPVEAINATVAIEDNTFWTNDGVNFLAIVRAASSDLSHQGISQGGSTITQQLIKYNLLNSNETFDRKVKEAILAYGMTTQGVYTKSQILEMYLNTIPYGREAYGIDAAAHSYFSYDDDLDTGTTAAQHLDLAQAAMLAGIPQNPNLNNPLLHPQHGHARQSDVLQAMVSNGYITQAQADAAYAEAAKPDFFHPAPPPTNLAPHFTQYIVDQLQDMVLNGQIGPLSRSGLNVYTTLDLDLQNHVQDAMKQHLYGDDRDDYVGHHFIRDDHVTNSAALLVDHHTGAIKVMLGSVDFNNDSIDGQVNVVTDGYRGPGSTFKPIVYATAFEKGWFPGMVVSDTPTIFYDAGSDTNYKPLNFNIHQFNHEVTLRKALQYSLNIPAVKVMQFAGVDDVQANAERWGIRNWEGAWGLSSVLGSLDVTLYDMTQVYTVFANYGQYIPLRAISTITDGSGNVVFQYHQPRPVQVMPPQIAFLITSILSDNPARAGDFGACSPLYLDPDKADCQSYNGNSPNAWPAAAKTGTGQDFRDDYTLGYTNDYTMGVWAGNTDHSPMLRIDGITGAAPIFYHGMLYAERNLPKTPFLVPAGVHQAIYTSNGLTSTDWFLDGYTLPDNTGNGGPSYDPCLIYHPNEANPWDFCPPGYNPTPPGGSGGPGGAPTPTAGPVVPG